MSDQPLPNGEPNMAPQGPLVLNLQYTKDLSFEVPGAPEIFATLREQPRVDLQLDVQARPIQDGATSSRSRCRSAPMPRPRASPASSPSWSICGIFTITVPQEQLEPVLLVECPRLLFPFARNILADVTRDGGFPPVMLSPIDFVALWQSPPWRGRGGRHRLSGFTSGGRFSAGPSLIGCFSVACSRPSR